jgi:hypothetical protein
MVAAGPTNESMACSVLFGIAAPETPGFVYACHV